MKGLEDDFWLEVAMIVASFWDVVIFHLGFSGEMAAQNSRSQL